MKKSTKGAIAAAAAGVLLLGGAGTLAYWTDDANVDAGQLESGSITLGAVTCAGWKYVSDDSAVVKIVPGDVVYNNCATSLTLVGDNIGATLDIDDASIPAGDLGTDLDPTVELQTAAGAPIAGVNTAGVTPVTAHVVVDFPYDGPVTTPDPTTGAKNLSQNGTAVLNALTLVAVQTNVDLP